ncbi:MAG: hypothetical protein LBG97_05430 [Coriobacteriales bacterium]|jgi:tight adherence protein B|nr:hypothetical protein [Coriobacteriales bacterium]
MALFKKSSKKNPTKSPKKSLTKGSKKKREPQYYQSAANMSVLNYKVYYLNKMQQVLLFLSGFVVGAAIGYLFYGGIASDEFGNPTTLTMILNITICSITGTITGIAVQPIVVKAIIARRKKTLSAQFRDMLEALSTSLGSGKNVSDSFRAILDDMRIQYEEDAFIIAELEAILAGMNININIEDLLIDFGERSGSDDILSFGNVFKVCYRKGGNINDTVRNTHTILCEKMEIAEDIETTVSANKLEQNIMVVIPIVLIALIKMMSPEFAANFVSVAGIISSTVAIVLFVIAFYVGKQVLDIKV